MTALTQREEAKKDRVADDEFRRASWIVQVGASRVEHNGCYDDKQPSQNKLRFDAL